MKRAHSACTGVPCLTEQEQEIIRAEGKLLIFEVQGRQSRKPWGLLELG